MSKERDKIIDLLLNKAALKQDVADYSESIMQLFKEVANEELALLRKEINDQRVRLRIEDKGTHDFSLFVGSDVLVFQLHHNIFRLPDESPLWKTKYLKENGANGYFAIISIYNFLAESFEQNRYNDAGYLIGRILLNHDERFIVEGKGNLAEKFQDLPKNKLSRALIQKILQCATTFAIEFDLITPPYEVVQEASVMEIQAITSESKMKTGKRLGFKFSTDTDFQ